MADEIGASLAAVVDHSTAFMRLVHPEDRRELAELLRDELSSVTHGKPLAKRLISENKSKGADDSMTLVRELACEIAMADWLLRESGADAEASYVIAAGITGTVNKLLTGNKVAELGADWPLLARPSSVPGVRLLTSEEARRKFGGSTILIPMSRPPPAGPRKVD